MGNPIKGNFIVHYHLRRGLTVLDAQVRHEVIGRAFDKSLCLEEEVYKLPKKVEEQLESKQIHAFIDEVVSKACELDNRFDQKNGTRQHHD